MNTKQIIENMEKEFEFQFVSRDGIFSFKNDVWPYMVKSFIRSYTRTFLESFGKEVIMTPNIGSEFDTFKPMAAVKRFRKLQRLKVKEIISSIKK